MAAYFVVAIGVAIDHGHYISMPFLCLFLCGFGYVGWGSLWQGGVGVALRGLFGRRGVTVVAPPRLSRRWLPPRLELTDRHRRSDATLYRAAQTRR